MEQIVKARIVLAHGGTDTDNTQIAKPNELILYDFEKPLANNLANKEIRLRIGDGKTSISYLPDLVLDNMNFYNSKPANPETGDVWYNEAEETFYLENSVYEEVEITKENYKPNIYYKWLTDKYVLDTNDNWVENQNYYVLKSNPIKLSHVIENIEDGVGEGSIQTTDKSNAIGNYSSALGYDTQAGSKGFKVIDKNATNKTYTLETENISNIAADDKFSIVLTNNYDFHGKIVAIDTENKIVTVDNFIDDIVKDTSYILLYEKPEAGDYIIGTGAHAEGYQTWAEGVGAHAEGYYTKAAGKYSHTEGKDSKAGYASHAEGSGTTAKFSAHAEGGSTTAWGDYSHAEGINTVANGHSSHVEGQNTISSETASHAEGYSTKANGKYSHAEGVSTIANEMAAHAEGNTTEANGKFSHAEGSATKANGENSHAEGTTTNASGINSHAEGNGTTASGNAAHTEGQGTIASGDQAHAEGYKSQASYQAAHAEGYATTATKIGAHAEGSSTEATGDGAHAEGYDTIASGPYSHAEGSSTTAVSFVTHAEGQGTIARGNAQHVQGKYNIEDTNKEYAHIVGNGTSNEQRSNAHTVDWDGNAWYAGSVKGEGIIEGSKIKSPKIETSEISVTSDDNEYQTLITSEAIQTTGTIAGKQLNINLKAVIDNNRNIIGQTITSQGEIKGQELNINDEATIDENGNGSFTSLTVGNEYPVLNYVGAGETLPNVAKEGDIFRIPSKRIEIEKNTIIQCSNSMINGCIGGFKGKLYSSSFISPISYGDESLNMCILTFADTNLYQLFQVYSSSAVVLDFKDKTLILTIIDAQYSGEDLQILVEGILATEIQEEYLNKYNNFYLYGVNDLNNFELEASLKGTTPLSDNTLFNYIIKLIKNVYPINDELLLNTGGMYQLNPAVRFTCSWADYISYGEFVITAIGFDGETYYITYDEDSGAWGDLMDQNIYQVGSPQLTALNYIYNSETTYYIYSQDFGWESLGEGTNLLNPVTSNSNIPLIGYSEYCKYQVTEKDDLPSILEKAVEDGNTLLYIEEGEYNGLTYILPYSNLQIIGLGRVVFNFKIYEPILKSLQQTQTYEFHNIIFNNIYEHQGLKDENDNIITAVLNEVNFIQCEIRKPISVGSGKFINCSIYNSIDNVIGSVYTIASSYDNSNFYFNQSNMKSYTLWANSIKNCNFYIGKNVETIIIKDGFYSLPYIYNNNFYITTRNCQMQATSLETIKITESNFLQYPFSNIECIDEETCYINSNVNYEDKDLHYKGIIDSEAFNKIVEKTEGDLYNVEEDVYKNGVGSIYYKITPQDQNYSDAITCIGEYNNYNDYRITGVTGGFANIITDLYNISEGITQLTDKIQINLYSEIFDETLIIPYEAHLYYNDLPDNKVQAMYELCFHYYGYDRANKPIDWFSSSIQGYFITSSSLNYATKDYEKIHHTEKIDSREKIGVTNSLKVYKEDDWENLIKGIPLNYKGQLEKYSYLPENKNIGDLYSVLSTTKNIYNRDQSGTFLGYNSLVIGQGDITFTNNGSDNNTFILTLSENTELRKILCHYVGAYDFGTKNYKSINLSFNNYKGIELIYSQSPEYNYFKIYKVEYNGDKNEIKIEGEVSAYETTYPPYTFAKGETMSIRFSNSATLINDYLNKSIYINSYPSGKWFWDGIEWVFFDQKEIFTDQIQYSTRDIEKNSNLKTGTLYIVYEEDDE